MLASITKLRMIYPDVTTDRLCAMHDAAASIEPRRRPHAELHIQGSMYYEGLNIAGIGWIAPALQSDMEIKRILSYHGTGLSRQGARGNG
jgi:hypothetical protein